VVSNFGVWPVIVVQALSGSISHRTCVADPFHCRPVGHINHSLFWKNLAKASTHGGIGGTLQDGPFSQAIAKDFGSLDALKKEFNAATAAIQGSGWGWLVSLHLNQLDARLER